MAKGDSVAGDRLAAGWLVLLNARDTVRDVPRVVVLTRSPRRLIVGDDLELQFAQGFSAVWTGRLDGIRRFAPGATGQWVKRFPARQAAQAAAFVRAVLRFPVAVAEAYVAGPNAVTITDRFNYRTFPDEWGTRPHTWAPLPPVLSLVRTDSPLSLPVQGRVHDLNLPTKHGPLTAVAGDSVTYGLPLPATGHYGVIPVQGRMALTKKIDPFALSGIRSVTRASGGLTTADPYLADLRAYMSSGAFANPFAAPCIDLYKWWYCFPTILGRPALSPEVRREVDAHYRRCCVQTLNFYPHKSLIRYRREPWTGLDYALTFIWPVQWRQGVRWFTDENETASVVLYCLWTYAQYYGDWTTVVSNWNAVGAYHSYLRRVHDWAFMCSSNQEFFSTVGIDMLNSEYPGNLAYARMAHQVGDAEAESVGLYLAAKAQIPTVARLFMPTYVASLTSPGDPWLKWRFFWSSHETGFSGADTVVMRGDSNTVLGLAIGLLDTSKGTGPEICELYRAFASEQIAAYERALEGAEQKYANPAGPALLMMRALLGQPRAQLVATGHANLERRPNQGWQAAKAPGNLALVCVADQGVWLVDWAPAGYASGPFNPQTGELRLGFVNREADSVRIRLHTTREVTSARIDGKPVRGWQWDRSTREWSAALSGVGAHELVLQTRR